MIKNVGMLGDSIAQGYCDEKGLGWFVRLGKLMQENSDDIYILNNMSQAGNSVADTTNRAASEVLTRWFDLILVNTGINDLRRRKDNDLQLDFSDGARLMYWEKLLDILAVSKAKVVVLDLIPVVESLPSENEMVVRYNADVEHYNQMIKEICHKRGVYFFARYDKWKSRDLNALYTDSAHPNAEGHKIMAEEVFTYLKENKLL